MRVLDTFGRDLKFAFRGLVRNPLFTIVAVWHEAPGAPGLSSIAGGLNLSPSMFLTYRDESRSFSSIGLWIAQNAGVTGLAEPQQVPAAAVTGAVLGAE